MSQQSNIERFSPLLAVASYFFVAVVLSFFVPQTVELQRALVLVELAIPLVFLRAPDSSNRHGMLHAMLWHGLTWACACASASLFQFLSGQDVFWQTRLLSLSTWMCVSGGLALGAMLKSEWVWRIRIILLMLFTLPPLWEYLSLEYAGNTVGYLVGISPVWAWTTGGDCLALLAIGVVCWLAALGIRPKPVTVAAASLLACATPLIAQDQLELLSPQFGRPGSWAPARLTTTETGATKIVSRAPGTSLTLQANLPEDGVVIPVFLGEGSQLEVDGRVLDVEVAGPKRPVPIDYRIPYVAVFAPDAINARNYYPTASSLRFCDYYSDSEFFRDWRYLDGYDVVVLFHPQGANLPVEASRVLAQFASLGGTVIVVGSFQFDENAEGLPPPSEPRVLQFRSLVARKFGYGSGAIYRLGWQDIRDSSQPADVIDQLVQNHRWYGAQKAPAGKPNSRVSGTEPLFLPPQGGFDNPPGLISLGLLGGFFIALLMSTVAVQRARRKRWLVPVAVFGSALIFGSAGLLLPSPEPTAETAIVVMGDGQQNSPASARIWLQVEQATVLSFELNKGGNQPLARPVHTGGWMGLQMDVPLVQEVTANEFSVQMDAGRVNGTSFRDYVTAARKGRTQFSTDQAQILEWWLEHNAWRGRRSVIRPAQFELSRGALAGLRVRPRGVLLVSEAQE
ncbi:MAG: hypothetical protein ACYTDT_05865 [Planctomycetota bacterium]|jgi:hypothetical protein